LPSLRPTPRPLQSAQPAQHALQITQPTQHAAQSVIDHKLHQASPTLATSHLIPREDKKAYNEKKASEQLTQIPLPSSQLQSSPVDFSASQPKPRPDLKEDKNTTVQVVLPSIDISQRAAPTDAQNLSSPSIPVPPPLDAEDSIDSKESKDSKHESASQHISLLATSNIAAPRFAPALSFQEELVKRQQERQARREERPVIGDKAALPVENSQRSDQTPDKRFGGSDLAAHLRLALERIRVVVGESKTTDPKRSQSSMSNKSGGGDPPSSEIPKFGGRKQEKDDDDDEYDEADWL